MDSTGLQLEKFLSVWIQGDGEEDRPTAFTNMYVRTATLDFQKRVGFLQPLQGRSHQIKQVLTPGQKQFLQQWLATEAPQAWEATDDHFKMLFEVRMIAICPSSIDECQSCPTASCGRSVLSC